MGCQKMTGHFQQRIQTLRNSLSGIARLRLVSARANTVILSSLGLQAACIENSQDFVATNKGQNIIDHTWISRDLGSIGMAISATPPSPGHGHRRAPIALCGYGSGPVSTEAPTAGHTHARMNHSLQTYGRVWCARPAAHVWSRRHAQCHFLRRGLTTTVERHSPCLGGLPQSHQRVGTLILLGLRGGRGSRMIQYSCTPKVFEGSKDRAA